MLDRRQLLTKAPLLTLAVLPALVPQKVQAQALSVEQLVEAAVREIIVDQIWIADDKWRELVLLAYTAYRLRQVYHQMFVKATGLDKSEYGDYQFFLNEIQATQVIGEMKDSAAMLSPAIIVEAYTSDGVIRRASAFLDWLSIIGIEPSGQLAFDLVKAQAFFAMVVGRAALREGNVPSPMTDDGDCWWAYPFCW